MDKISIMRIASLDATRHEAFDTLDQLAAYVQADSRNFAFYYWDTPGMSIQLLRGWPNQQESEVKVFTERGVETTRFASHTDALTYWIACLKAAMTPDEAA